MKPKSRRVVYRRGSDSRWQKWWPIIVTLAAYVISLLSVYVGMSNKLAVQSEQIVNLQKSADGMKADLKERIDSLERNFSGVQNLLVTMHQNEPRIH